MKVEKIISVCWKVICGLFVSFWTIIAIVAITTITNQDRIISASKRYFNPDMAIRYIENAVKLEMRAADGTLLAEPVYLEEPDFFGDVIFVGQSGRIYYTSIGNEEIADENGLPVATIYARHFRVPNSATEPWFGKPRPYMQMGKCGMESAHSNQ